MPKFVPRQRKHKARARQNGGASGGGGTAHDTNAAELIPASQSEREARKKQLREDLRAGKPPSKASGKKQKRLEKYIETKLRKEENLELMKKLAAQAGVDRSGLESSRLLGAGKGGVKRRGEVEEERKDSEGSSGEDEDEGETRTGLKAQTMPATSTTSLGSGLKRPLEIGEDGRPVIKKLKRRGGIKQKRKLSAEVVQEPAWEGFSSESDQGSGLEEELETSDALSEEEEEEVDSAGSEEEAGEASTSGESGEPTEEDEDSDDSDNEEDEGDDGGKEQTKQRSSAFKAWATQKRNEALGFVPSAIPAEADPSLPPPKPISFQPRAPEQDPLPQELRADTATDKTRKAFSVPVERPLEVQQARLGLPVVAEEQKIMEAIYNNNTVVIWGATGSGKTTQVPQFLYEAGFGAPDGPYPGMIGVTQPRRVAAVSMAKRVSDELNAPEKVAYQIRFERTVSNKTTVKFMTDGVLLREIAQDFSLTAYSAIVIDEAHERSVNTDILIGMMSRIVDLRAQMHKEDPKVTPLKLIIMSATLRISDFTENTNLFRHGPPPLLQAEGRQYPVTNHFARRTERDYLEAAFQKVSKGHRKLPPGAMLVFLTSQNEIQILAKRLKQAFISTQGTDTKGPTVRISATEAPLETEDIDFGGLEEEDPADYDSDSETEIHGLDDEDDKDFDIGESTSERASTVHVLPLFSQLPTKEQLKVFEPPPEGSRLIVLATNVAETSLTIPGVRYVFDCGRAKEKKYNRLTGVQSFEVGWISKASASQRAGRAGRTGPGHCYRLYSSAVYERDFEEYAEPEILRMPIEGVVLQLKSMDLQHVLNFPFPTPPDRASLAKAEKLLTYLGALSPSGNITDFGRSMSIYPLSPRFSKMLLIGHQHKCMPYTIALVAALSVADIFIPESQLDLKTPERDPDVPITNADNIAEDARSERRKAYNRARALFSSHDSSSDALKLLTATCAFAHASDPEKFCAEHFLRLKALQEASQLRAQLSEIVRMNRPGVLGPYTPKLPQPSATQLKVLKQIVAAGFLDHVAIRADLAPDPPEQARKPKRAIDAPYLPLFPSHARRADDDDKAVYLHPSSVLAHSTTPADLPQFLVYSHLQRSSPSGAVDSGKTSKIRMHALVPVSGGQLAALARATPLLEYGKPVGKAVPIEGGKPEKRECFVVPSLKGEKGTLGWPLPAVRVRQRKDLKEGWVVEEWGC